MAERAIHELKEILSHGSDKQLSWQLEEAQLFWARGEENTAKHVMKGLIHTVSKVGNPRGCIPAMGKGCHPPVSRKLNGTQPSRLLPSGKWFFPLNKIMVS